MMMPKRSGTQHNATTCTLVYPVYPPIERGYTGTGYGPRKEAMNTTLSSDSELIDIGETT